MVKETGLYDELGIASDATEQQIRAAYRSMALKYHPDKNNGDAAAAEKFKKIAEAYEILSDADRRKQYDAFGRGGPGGGRSSGFPQGFPGGAGFGPGMDPMDIFSHFFGFSAGGGSGGGGQQQQQRQQKPSFILVELQLSLEEMYCGTVKVLQVRRRRMCKACHSHGTANGKPVPACVLCKGARTVTRQISFGGLMTYQQCRCEACQGTGKQAVARVCPVCGPVYAASATATGKDALPRGVVLEEKKVRATIVPGTEDSDAVHFLGQGDELPGYDAVGDILVVLEQLPHPCYRRLNTVDLLLSNCRLPLSFLFKEDVALPVELLDGRVVRLAPPLREGGVPRFLFDSQHVFVVENEGMPLKEQPSHAAASSSAADEEGGKQGTSTAAHLKKGKLYVCVEVCFPATLTSAQVETITQALGGDGGSDVATESSPGAAVASLKPHHGPAPSWHTVDAQGNASYKSNAASGKTKKKRKAAAAA